MPVYLRWYYWVSPTAYSVYGIIVSQYGESQDIMTNGQTVQHFLKENFGFRHKMVGLVASMLLVFVVTFTLIITIAFKTLNFQKR